MSNTSPNVDAPPDRGLLKLGVVGSITAAVFCFTPVLVVLLGAIGLSAWLAWLDYVLVPAMVLFAGVTAYALMRRKKKPATE